MPWCSFPWHKLLSRLTQKNCYIYTLQSKFDPWVYIRVFNQPALCRFAWESLPGETGKGRHWTPVFFCGCASNAPRFAQGQPNGYFQMKELDRTTEPIARMNVEWKLEKAEFAEFKLPTCGHIAVCQPYRDRQIQSLFRTSSLFSTKVIVAGLPRKSFPRKQAFVDISAFRWMRKQQPRFAQGQPKGYSKWRFFQNAGSCKRAQGRVQDILYVHSYTHRARASTRGFVHWKNNCAFRRPEKKKKKLLEQCWTIEAMVPMNERWRKLNANMSQSQYVPLCANIAVWQLCRERQPL